MVISVALRSYYRRLHGNTIIELENEEVQLAERAWADSSVYSSCMHRTRKHLITRADNFVMFEAGRFRSGQCWFVGEVLCYLAHNQAGSTGFFAVVDVMQHHSISNFV
ncbi:hypothetical protein G6F56_013974 [Rhizopus delemar]|nr:hypothetical protein G6F56_013974 [Rhizopus delemar]